MKKIKYTGPLLVLAVIVCFLLDGVQESFCWYLYYGSPATSIIMTSALALIAIGFVMDETIRGYAIATNILGILLTMNYQGGNEIVFFLHDFFSYGFLLIFVTHLHWSAILLLASFIGIFEYNEIQNYYQELVALGILIPWGMIQSRRNESK